MSELDASWAANPYPGRINAIHRLNRTGYTNTIYARQCHACAREAPQDSSLGGTVRVGLFRGKGWKGWDPSSQGRARTRRTRPNCLA